MALFSRSSGETKPPRRTILHGYNGQEFTQSGQGVAINEKYVPGDGTLSVIYDPRVLERMQNDAFRDSNLGRLSMLFASPPPPELQDPPQEGGSQHT